MDSSQTSLLAGTAIIEHGRVAYMRLPADQIRTFFESKLPYFEKCADADKVPWRDIPGGGGHRWDYGHDLLVDVPRTFFREFFDHGPTRALTQAVHIVGTDFGTKAGMPIPGLSGQGIGQWLVDAGIPKPYLNIHWYDGGLGILAINEGSTDLIQAISGKLAMNAGTFFDTFIEGGAEILLAHKFALALTALKFNPVLVMAGGIENILAGLISAYQAVSIYVDPLVFFGSAGTSSIIGFGIAYSLAGESPKDATIVGFRSGIVGALFTLSPAFGYGAIAGFISYRLGRKLATIHNKSQQALLTIDESAYQLLLEELCKGNADLTDFLNRVESHIILVESAATLPTESTILNTSVLTLSDQCQPLDSTVQTLSESTEQLKSDARTLPADSPILADWYRTALSGSRA
jgi:hypothetical protein